MLVLLVFARQRNLGVRSALIGLYGWGSGQSSALAALATVGVGGFGTRLPRLETGNRSIPSTGRRTGWLTAARG